MNLYTFGPVHIQARLYEKRIINTFDKSNICITFIFSVMKCSELLRLLRRDGWIEIRQTGSHIIMKHPTKAKQLAVPNHGSKEMKKGLLSVIIKDADLKTNKR